MSETAAVPVLLPGPGTEPDAGAPGVGDPDVRVPDVEDPGVGVGGVGGPDAGAPDARAAVVRALRRLDGLADRPLTEHVDAFEQVHAALGDALTAGTPDAR